MQTGSAILTACLASDLRSTQQSRVRWGDQVTQGLYKDLDNLSKPENPGFTHFLVKHAPLSGESSISSLTDPDSSDMVEDSLQQVETDIDSGEVDLSTIYV